MSYILIPQIVSSTTAMIWIGAVEEKVRLKLVYLEYSRINSAGEKVTERRRVDPSEWRTWKTRHVLDRIAAFETPVEVIYYQRVTLGLKKALKPRTEYTVKLLILDQTNNQEESAEFNDYSRMMNADDTAQVGNKRHTTEARVTTLPEHIPPEGKKPFTVMLGSCFYRENDLQGMVGKTYTNMPKAEKPEIKFLCGDQVYLDNPWTQTTFNIGLSFAAPEKMRNVFFQHYLQNWTQITLEEGRVAGGFNLLLRDGANYFCSDDHEFWNNAPDFGGVAAVLTFLRGQRDWWFREASELFRLFQSLAPWMTFDVPPVSFCIADTRINRLTGKKQFIEEDDLEAVGNWIQNLSGPGVLVIGQLLMEEKTKFPASLFDKSLPDYPRQYQKLLNYISDSNHSIVVLTGDVHYGRVAICDLDAEKGTKFVEVVSSPLFVVSNWRNKARVGEYKKAPKIFGTTVKNYQVANLQNHYVTLEFSEDAAKKISMTVKAWKILLPETDNAPESDIICTIELN